jgi:hypothetical protein
VVELNSGKHFPQLGGLNYVLNRTALLRVVLDDPKIILHCHLHRAFPFL